MNLGATLAKQVGPLPLGVWLLVGTGGLFIAYRQSKADAPAVEPAPGEGLPVGGGDGPVSSWDGAPVVLSPIIQITPRVGVNDSIPDTYTDPPAAPTPLPVPASPPRVAPRPAPKPVVKAPVRKPAPVVKAVVRKPAPKPAAPKTVTVKKGDTLSGLFGSKWGSVYKANKSTLDAAAKSHGQASAKGGNLIYAGTKLRVP